MALACFWKGGLISCSKTGSVLYDKNLKLVLSGMRRLIAMMFFMAMPFLAFAQIQITTKKEKISSFPTKITKVVLSGNEFKDQAVKEAVKNAWRISPFEFCDIMEFEKLKTNPDLYFLVLSDTKTKKETKPGISMFFLVKGDEGAGGLEDMLEVASIPVCAADFPSGKEAAMMPALLDIMQSYIAKTLSGAFASMRSVVKSKWQTGGITVVFDKEDFSPGVNAKDIEEKFGSRVSIGSGEDVIHAMVSGCENTAVGYIVAPAEPEIGSVCYAMLIDAETHELYYFKKSVVSKNAGAGFRKADINKILLAKR